MNRTPEQLHAAIEISQMELSNRSIPVSEIKRRIASMMLDLIAEQLDMEVSVDPNRHSVRFEGSLYILKVK